MKFLSTGFKTLFFLSLMVATGIQAMASHGMGGELTWRCLGNGAYIFQLKFYRDCNGIPGPSSINIDTNIPGTLSIAAQKIAQNDLSPQGFETDGITPCPICANGGFGNPIPGLVEEHIFESDTIILTGVPPPGGWEFSWGECCRSSALTNIVGAGGIGFSYRAKMYSPFGQNASTCFDSSPFFAEQPNFYTCTGSPVTYQQLAGDVEYDSLVYEFDQPLDDLGNFVPFAPGYTVQQPMADSVTLDPHTGEISFTPLTPGYYCLVIKVSEYKCGLLAAEIRREMNVAITANCPTLQTGLANTPPLVNAPFIDQNTGLQTSYADTVIAGDSVNFSITATDAELFGNGNPQTVTLDAFGLQYGTGYTDPTAGCIIPPCATLGTTPPVSAPTTASLQFNWGTTTAHLGYSFACVQFSNTYYFLNKVYDNYCPANAGSSRVISITVMPAIPPPPIINNNGNLECNLGPNYIYQWFLNRFAIPGASAYSYTPTVSGNYQVLAVAPNGQGNYSAGYQFTAVGVNEVNNELRYSVNPNPAPDGRFEISWNQVSAGALSGCVRDVSGRTVIAPFVFAMASSHKFTLDLSSQSVGVYFLEIRNTNGIARTDEVGEITRGIKKDQVSCSTNKS